MEGIGENGGAFDVTTSRHVVPWQSIQDSHSLYLVAYLPISATDSALFATMIGLFVTMKDLLLTSSLFFATSPALLVATSALRIHPKS
jgi:hypothetical protein